MSIPSLYPLNDLAFLVTLKIADPVTGAMAPLETGTVTAFLATSDAPDAVAADGTLVATVVYTGRHGKWLVSFDAAILTVALLASKFTAATPYCIVQAPSAVRFAIELAYDTTRSVTPT